MAKSRKQEVRSEMRRILANLDRRWLSAAAGRLNENLAHLVDSQLGLPVHHVLAWTSFFTGEADLTPFISDQIEKRTVYLPHTLEDGSMRFVSLGANWSDVLESGAFGIAEPPVDSGKSYDPANSSTTIVLVPGIAFDKEGSRLGRGKGFYDRFLGRSSMRNAIKVGICWSMQLLDEVPTESEDVPVDWIVHERGILKTSLSYEED